MIHPITETLAERVGRLQRLVRATGGALDGVVITEADWQTERESLPPGPEIPPDTLAGIPVHVVKRTDQLADKARALLLERGCHQIAVVTNGHTIELTERAGAK